MRHVPPSTRRLLAALALSALPFLTGCGAPDGAGAGPGGAPAPVGPAPSGSPATPGASALPTAVDPTHVELTVAGGEVRGAPGRVEVPLGGTVRLTVTADTVDDVHVHGYDRTLALAPGTPASVDLVADIPGVFEVELHESGLALTSLQVQ